MPSAVRFWGLCTSDKVRFWKRVLDSLCMTWTHLHRLKSLRKVSRLRKIGSKGKESSRLRVPNSRDCYKSERFGGFFWSDWALWEIVVLGKERWVVSRHCGNEEGSSNDWGGVSVGMALIRVGSLRCDLSFCKDFGDVHAIDVSNGVELQLKGMWWEVEWGSCWDLRLDKHSKSFNQNIERIKRCWIGHSKKLNHQ